VVRTIDAVVATVVSPAVRAAQMASGTTANASTTANVTIVWRQPIIAMPRSNTDGRSPATADRSRSARKSWPPVEPAPIYT
jgi:hypothetical protein